MMRVESLDYHVISLIVGVVLALVVSLTFVSSYKQILVFLKKIFKLLKENLFTWTGFFWFVNVVCMSFSAQNAGYIFGLYEPSTGILVGVAIDLLIIAFTQSMLSAKARGETDRATKILCFIVFCCLLSTIGNLAHNLHMNVDQQTSHVWFSQILPYVVSTMPLFLIALAWVADLKVSPVAAESLESYRANQRKQTDFQEANIENREREENLKVRMIAVERLAKQNQRLRRGKLPKSFRWPWEQPMQIDLLISGVSEQLKAVYEPQIASLKTEIEAMKVLEIDLQSLRDSSKKSNEIDLQSLRDSAKKSSEIDLQSLRDSSKKSNEIDLQSLRDSSKKSSAISEKNTDELTKIEAQSQERLKEKVTRKLSVSELETPKKVYAITKKEAAEKLKCSLKDIERSIKDGDLKPYGNNNDKVLLSSLENYVSSRRKLRIVGR